MKIPCQHTKEKWEAHKRGLSLNPQELDEITKHLQTCSDCREYIYQHSLYPLLKKSYGEETPEPSEHFFDNLAQKLHELECHTQEATPTEILLQKGWKLVPVMTVLLVLLLGSFVYQYKNISSALSHIPIEEVILFEDTSLNENQILYAIITEELKNGK